ncbi:MAG: SIS domain-containing protein [bacterium]|nr:SIS domain-containing protein [bacterium]MDZ4299765.1 SIS domain-containing protein [Candidatus Sungbacteria bacterium]
MMRDAILSFPRQFSYMPHVARADLLGGPTARVLVVGMGGSHLAADILAGAAPELGIVVHSDYGLPTMPAYERSEMLVIASSYSGNTEETLDAFAHAGAAHLPRAAIAVGGELIRRAEEAGVPTIQLPDTNIQPRSALGFGVRALLKLLGRDDYLHDTAALAKLLIPAALEPQGRMLAEWCRGRIPVIYASAKNRAVAQNWKIKLNETGKIPAFFNVVPELNHNEMTGFSAGGGSAFGGDAQQSTRGLNAPFCFILLDDEADHPQNRKRMRVLAELLTMRGLPVTTLMLTGRNVWEKIFSSLLIADWTALHTAEQYGVESEQVPMVEEFKRMIAGSLPV